MKDFSRFNKEKTEISSDAKICVEYGYELRS